MNRRRNRFESRKRQNKSGSENYDDLCNNHPWLDEDRFKEWETRVGRSECSVGLLSRFEEIRASVFDACKEGDVYSLSAREKVGDLLGSDPKVSYEELNRDERTALRGDTLTEIHKSGGFPQDASIYLKLALLDEKMRTRGKEKGLLLPDLSSEESECYEKGMEIMRLMIVLDKLRKDIEMLIEMEVQRQFGLGLRRVF